MLILAPVWVSENERLSVLGGQVSVKISLISNVDEIRYAVDEVGEDEIQYIESKSYKRARFTYNGESYIINVNDFIDSDSVVGKQAEISIYKEKEK